MSKEDEKKWDKMHKIDLEKLIKEGGEIKFDCAKCGTELKLIHKKGGSFISGENSFQKNLKDNNE